MAVSEDYTLAFNRGVISPLANARADVKRVGMSAEEQMNMIPRTMGPMSLRPGMKYLGSVAQVADAIKLIPFVFNNGDTALLEVTDREMRIWVDDALISRPTVSTTVTNGSFATDLTGWSNSDQGLASSAWFTGGYMCLTGTNTHRAVRSSSMSIAVADRGIEHGLEIHVTQGMVGLRVGTTSTNDDLITDTQLEAGRHYLSFTPGASITTVYITFYNYKEITALVGSCLTTVVPGVVSIPAELLLEETLDDVRYAQSGDTIFLTLGRTYRPVKIERRSARSWSVVNYETSGGPFLAANTTPITITPSAITGDSITLTASQGIFKAEHVGAMWKLDSSGQLVTRSLGVTDAATEPIRISGVGAVRNADITITGAWSGNVLLEKSLTEPGRWATLGKYNTNLALVDANDGIDNAVIYYRLRKEAGGTGTAVCSIRTKYGSKSGVVQITGYTSPTVVTARVVQTLGSLDPTEDWAEGAWSALRGYPTSVAFFQGRLWWAGKDKVWASVVDDYYNFDPEYVGDAGPISRSMGIGAVDIIQWLCPLRQLIAGGEGAEHSCRSSTLGEPLTPTNFNIRQEGTYGSASVEVVRADDTAIFVDRTGARIMSLTSADDAAEITELSLLTPELCLPNIKRVAVQRRPDMRIHLLRCDGTVVMLIFDKVEQVNCFITIETTGLIEDVAVLPGATEDAVYYVVSRVVNGSVVRYLEKWALTSETVGGTINKMADAFLEVTQASSIAVTGLEHLERKEVTVWGNNKNLGTYGVIGGRIVLTEEVTYCIVGLHYYGRFISSKLGLLTAGQAALSKRTRVLKAGLILKDTDHGSLTYGTDVDHLDNLPLIEAEAEVADGTLWDSFDNDPLSFNGTFSNDTRLVLRADAPMPCTVVAAVITIEKQ